MKNIFRGGALLAAICFVFALAAKADDIHLCAAGSDCNTGSVIAISSGTTSATLSGGHPGLIGQQLFLAAIPALDPDSPVSAYQDLKTRTTPRRTNHRFSGCQSEPPTKVSLFRLQCLKRI